MRPEPTLDGDNARDNLLVQFVVQLKLLRLAQKHFGVAELEVVSAQVEHHHDMFHIVLRTEPGIKILM